MRLNFAALLFTLCFLGFAQAAQAQFARTIHRHFEVEDATQIQLNLVGDVEVENWEGNTLLIQTDIHIYNASKGIFTHFVDKVGRYEIEAAVNGDVLDVRHLHQERKLISTKNGVATEDVKVKVFMPRYFEGSGLGPYVKNQPDSDSGK